MDGEASAASLQYTITHWPMLFILGDYRASPFFPAIYLVICRSMASPMVISCHYHALSQSIASRRRENARVSVCDMWSARRAKCLLFSLSRHFSRRDRLIFRYCCFDDAQRRRHHMLDDAAFIFDIELLAIMPRAATGRSIGAKMPILARWRRAAAACLRLSCFYCHAISF